MLIKIKQTLGRYILNLPGWHTNRKIVVIESDDWGSIRMPSKAAYNALLKSNVPVENDPYCLYDCLESEDDLSALFEVLLSVRDSKDNPAIITANCAVANPDFDKIRRSNFQQYFLEPFTKTLKRYSHHSDAFTLWKQGISNKLFYPQFHGREHLHVGKWMKALQTGDPDMRLAFDWDCFGINSRYISGKRNNYMAAFDSYEPEELVKTQQIVGEGLNIFKEIFGYSSDSIIAPCYIWHPQLENYVSSLNVKFIQGMLYQTVPNSFKYKSKLHYTGEKNKSNQVYIVRNVHFEPSIIKHSSSVEDMIKRMQIIFSMKKPVIISTHRVNYIGELCERNRGENLILLRKLLQTIIKKWPEVEFMSTDKLGKLIIS